MGIQFDPSPRPLTLGSLFSGVGGIDLGLERAGMVLRWQVEIDPACLMVLGRHWPGVKRYGDVRTLDPAELQPVDLLCGGFPCQDVSVAGKRAGLAGRQSSLYWEFHRIASGLAPRWLLIENVPGLLSSHKGRDFQAILDSLVELGYGVAWRVLNAQYFGVAQRRRRVFIVGHLGEPWSAPAKVLFESESLPWHPAPRRGKGQEVAYALAAGAGGSKFGSGRDCQDTFVIQDVRGGTRDRTDHGQGIGISEEEVCYTLDATSRHGVACVPIGVSANQRGEVRLRSVHGCLTSERSAKQFDGVMVPIVAPTLSTKNEVASSSTQRWRWMEQSARLLGVVRRLTPLECERLQGFPDGWTAGESDSARYRMIGNSVAVPVLEWIGRRIIAAEEAMHDGSAV